MQLNITRTNSDLPLPMYATPGSVAFDLSAAEYVFIRPQETVLIPTGMIIEVPKGFFLMIALRSSLPRRKSLIMPHGVGIIDQDYCGPKDEIKVQVYNASNNPVPIDAGERIAQGLIIPIIRAEWNEAIINKPTRR